MAAEERAAWDLPPTAVRQRVQAFLGMLFDALERCVSAEMDGRRRTYVQRLEDAIHRDPSATDDEIRAAMRRLGPPRGDGSFQWALALGYNGWGDYLAAEERRRAQANAEAEEAAQRYAEERRDFQDSPLLHEIERAILAELLSYGHKPTLPPDCYHDDRVDARGMGGISDDDIHRATGTLALLLEWHTRDRPKDLTAWLRRVYVAATGLPLAALPHDARLEQLWRRYAPAARFKLLPRDA